jgi:copper chaperone CopZ
MARGAVEALEGVQEVKASLSDHTITVSFEDIWTDLEEIIEALNKGGYTVGEAKEIVPSAKADGT